MTTSRYDPLDLRSRHEDGAELEPAESTPAVDTLDLLRDAAEATAEDVAEALALVELAAPGGRIKLRCDPNIPQKQIDNARDDATPPHLRRKPLRKRMDKVDQVHAYARLIGEQTREVLIRNGNGGYARVVDRQNNPRDFTDPELLRMLGTADPTAAVRKVMGNWDAHILQRGGELMDAAGYSEDGADPS